MKYPDSSDEMVAITSSDMERFRRCAPAALQRREGTYVFGEFAAGLRWVFLGLVPIVGMLRFDWSPEQLLFFLLVGTWCAILCDFAKLAFLNQAIRKWAKTSYDTWQVWVIVDALRKGRTTAPRSHLRARYQPRAGVVVDVLCGGISTLLIWLLVKDVDQAFAWALLQERGVITSIVGLTVYQVLFAVWEIVQCRFGNGNGRHCQIAVGLRGVGLFLLMFLLVGLTEVSSLKTNATQIAMLVINGAIVLLGLVTIGGPLFVRKETAWLRDYLHKRKSRSQ